MEFHFHFNEAGFHCSRELHAKWKLGPVSEQTGPNQDKKVPNQQTAFLFGESDMAFSLKATQQCDFSVSEIKDKKGNQAKVDGPPIWTSSNQDILTVIADTDGMSSVVKAVGPTGTARISVVMDADLGPGKKELIGSIDIDVVAGDAAVINITPGDVTEQEEPPPAPEPTPVPAPTT